MSMNARRLAGARALGVLALTVLPALGHAQRLSARTGNALELGVETASYHYQEDANGSFLMANDGRMLGLSLLATEMIDPVRYVTAEVRHANGAVYYTSAGTGSQGSTSDSVSEVRFVAGRDVGSDLRTWSPYAGLGYRLLSDNATGFTSTGSPRYRSTREYYYLPIGLIYRHLLDRSARLAAQLEYDYLLEGSTRSRLSDMGGGLDDTVHTHRFGQGARLSLAYETLRWSFGVFHIRWDIQASDTNAVTSGGVFVMNRTEPHNTSQETGVQLRYRFN